MSYASIVTTMRYIHVTDQAKRRMIILLSDYLPQGKRRHKFATNEKQEAVFTCRKSLKIMVSRAGLEPATR
jgi:hypothetical protein